MTHLLDIAGVWKSFDEHPVLRGIDLQVDAHEAVVLIGASGSGKSTFAADAFAPYEVISSDFCRALVSGDENDQAATNDAFDVLYAEGATQPKMMSIGLHCRLVGRPGRIAGLARFLDHIQSHQQVWICTREAIARHWVAHHPPTA